jgi:hypothetical protein
LGTRGRAVWSKRYDLINDFETMLSQLEKRREAELREAREADRQKYGH